MCPYPGWLLNKDQWPLLFRATSLREKGIIRDKKRTMRASVPFLQEAIPSRASNSISLQKVVMEPTEVTYFGE